jgi:hypothetical protein
MSKTKVFFIEDEFGAQREHKPSRIEQMIEEMLKEEETKQKRKKRLAELTNKINK